MSREDLLYLFRNRSQTSLVILKTISKFLRSIRISLNPIVMLSMTSKILYICLQLIWNWNITGIRAQSVLILNVESCIKSETSLNIRNPQICHNPCHLRNVAKETVGDPNLMDCNAFGSDQTCSQCKCSY